MSTTNTKSSVVNGGAKAAANKVETLWYTRCPVPTPLGIAAQLGWVDEEFRRDGITVRTLQDEIDPKLRESHFDHTLDNSFRQGGNIPAIWARAKGRQTRVVGLTWTDEAQVILALPGSGITSVADLRGRKLGVVTRPAEQIDFWKATTLRAYVAALKLAGLTEKDVTLVELVRPSTSSQSGSQTGRRGWAGESPESSLEAQALLRGEVDAIFHKGSRGLEVAEAIGAVTVFDLGKHPDPAVRVNNGSPRTLTVDAGLLERDLGLVVRLVKRVIEAGQWAEEHPREAADYVATETGSPVAAVWKAYGDVHQHLRTDLEASSIAALGDFKDFLFQWGFLPNDFDVNAWIDPRPLRLALEAIAAEKQAKVTEKTAQGGNGAAQLDADELAFIEQFKKDVAKSAKVLWETRTLSPSQTFQVYQRIPGGDKYVSAPYPSIWDDGVVKVTVAGFDGTTYIGKSQGPGPGRYSRIFQKHPHITTAIHAHTPALGSWASSHRSLPIRYVPITRANVSKELPIYIDRRQAEQDFINDRLAEDPYLEAVVEANGGSTFWGNGVIATVKRIILIEEGAGYQLHAQALGGSKQYGPGVLEQQWRMGLVPKDVAAAALAEYHAAGGAQSYGEAPVATGGIPGVGAPAKA